jgi:hypothetical protein
MTSTGLQQARALKLAIIGLVILTPIVGAENFSVDRFDDSNTATTCSLFLSDDCSLRGAIIRANGNGEDDVIYLSMEGTYTLTLEGQGNDLGDLDITDNVVINGRNRHDIIIDASGVPSLAHIFEVPSGVTVTIRGVTITRATGAYANGSGGGIFNSGTLILEDVWIDSIWTTHNGGAVYNSATGWLEVHRSRISGNGAEMAGGGVFNNGTLKVVDTTFGFNTAYLGGGGILTQGTGQTTLTRTTFYLNTSYGDGGGVTNRGSLNAVNCTWDRNNASGSNGGAIYNLGQLDLTNVTIANNDAVEGTAIYNPPGYQVNIANTIVDGTCVTPALGITSFGGNIERPGTTCLLDHSTDQSVTAEILFPAAFAGGLTYSLPPIPGSPAIDSGLNILCSDEDQRGMPRPIDGDGDSSSVCDPGANEYNPDEIFLDGFESSAANYWSDVT